MRNQHRLVVIMLFLVSATVVIASQTAPDSIKQPGTQPTEVNSFASNCSTCHGNTANPAVEPQNAWQGGMMSHSMRDGLFWATLAVAEQDFVPNSDPALRGGAGDLCLRCHGPGGWLGGLSEPTDGSLYTNNEARGVECEFCHLMVNPDQVTNISGTDEIQNSPFEAYDSSSGEGYYGSAQYVINGEGTRLGPLGDAQANHPFYQSDFHRQGEICGSCHDVSNPAVGDLAHNFGAQLPLQAGSYSGDPASPLDQKAPFQNPPYAYGIVERTFSEWKASGLATLAVNDFATLPADLRVAGGALDTAYHRAYDSRNDADYEDGTVRTFTCQTCHMAAATGEACNKNGAPIRSDLPRHDQTGAGYWMPDVIAYQDNKGTLRLGDGLDDSQLSAMEEGKARAAAHLASAAALAAFDDDGDVLVRVTNLTGHKLLSGYPEGRRMWINVQWRNGSGVPIEEVGAYGQIGREVYDIDGVPHQIMSIIDPSSTTVYEVDAGMDQAWAAQLLGLGYSPDLVISYDRLTDTPVHFLGELAAEAPGISYHSFHFVLNNVIRSDNRIPPYGFLRSAATTRNALPVPASQYGDPTIDESYDYWDEVRFVTPAGAEEATVRLLYQQTSWEYIQFLWLANDGLSPFLGQEGVNMLDAWLNTGMSAPLELGSVTLSVSASPTIFIDGFDSGNLSSWSNAFP